MSKTVSFEVRKTRWCRQMTWIYFTILEHRDNQNWLKVIKNNKCTQNDPNCESWEKKWKTSLKMHWNLIFQKEKVLLKYGCHGHVKFVIQGSVSANCCQLNLKKFGDVGLAIKRYDCWKSARALIPSPPSRSPPPPPKWSDWRFKCYQERLAIYICSLRNFTGKVAATQSTNTSYQYQCLQDTFVFIQPSVITGTASGWRCIAQIVSSHSFFFSSLF